MSLEDKAIMLAQITDSHLFSSPGGLHLGYNVLNNLKKVLLNISGNPKIDFIVFTGDLTQDHSEQSYQNFVHCVHECGISKPIYYLAGNHDEHELLTKYFSVPPFVSDREKTMVHWQVQLLDSKSETPAGYVNEQTFTQLANTVKPDKHQLLMMHHHPIDVGYFIDKHGLQNKNDFWQFIHSYNNIKAIACGHVHGAMELISEQVNNKRVTLYTCPATSIQFDPSINGVGALEQGPGYRLFTLHDDGSLTSDVIYL